jgi:hypothetical protein
MDWALRDAGRGAVPITRPIRVECHADRIVVLPDEGKLGGKEIRLDKYTDDSLDELVAVLSKRMETWGIAGKNMYWRPVLQMRVAPGAEDRYRDLARLLDGSGLTIERR